LDEVGSEKIDIAKFQFIYFNTNKEAHSFFEDYERKHKVEEAPSLQTIESNRLKRNFWNL